MPNTISRFRLRVFKRQKGRCYYCGAPVWLNNLTEFAIKHRISERQAGRFKCTAEHLIARKDGGADVGNIVAACHFCNSTRHCRPSDMTLEDYRKLVTRRIERLKWHPRQFHNML